MHLEVPPLLRKIHYPFRHTICKSLLAAHDPKHWPTFLVLLHWMMKLVRTTEGNTGSEYECDGKIRTPMLLFSLRS